jgi:ATP-binding cassette, subfamily C, bacterial
MAAIFKSNKSLKSIALIAQQNPKAVTLVCLCLLLSSLLDALGISAIFPLITILLETHTNLPESRLTDFINSLSAFGPYFLAIFIIASFILKSLAMNVATSIIANNVATFSHKLRVSFVQAMLQARIHFILSRSLGENLSVLSNDSIRAASAYIFAARVLSGIFQVLLYFLYALWLSVEGTAISLLTMAALLILIKKTMNRTKRAGAETTRHIHEISRNMGETLRAAKEAKATAREDYFSSYIIEGSKKLRDAHAINIVVGQTLRNIQDPVTVTSALICLFVFKQGLGMEPGYIIFILAVYYRLMNALNLLLSDYQKFVSQETALWTIQDIIHAAEEARENPKQGGIAPSRVPQPIAFENVSMAYGDKKIFTNVSFTVPAQKLCVFKGESGRGKTTCADIICGLIEPTGGEIRVGQDLLRDIDTYQWRRHIGYVDQFPFLFRGSIRDNILLDAQDTPQEKLDECLRLCHLDKFVLSLPEGVDAQLHEGGSNISGGQRQRIAIARSVIRNPSYLILDEPTSALDQESADIVFKTLVELSATISVIVISHSEAANKYAHKIINFDVF